MIFSDNSGSGDPPHPTSSFPNSFLLFQKRVIISRNFMIGESKNKALYMVSHTRGDGGKPNVTLHSGTTHDDPPIATVKINGAVRNFTLTLGYGDGNTGPPEEFTVNYDLSLPGGGGYVFTVPVSSGREETFEWRHSVGSAVNELSGEPFG